MRTPQFALALAALALAVTTAAPLGATPPPKPAVVVPPPAPVVAAPLPHVEITTSAGKIVVRLEAKRAPLTAANFLRYVDAKRFDGGEFYRTTQSWGPGASLIQGGSNPKLPRFAAVKHEPTSTTGLTHCVGALSMARGTPDSGTSDFFILLSPIKDFDSKAATGGDPGFAVFGEVVSGLEIAQTIFSAPVDAAKGNGVMKGQIIAAPVKILSVRRTQPKLEIGSAEKSCFAPPK
jgi:peptidyl-prolyl cis-trans isomerase A (cyclophilin A)